MGVRAGGVVVAGLAAVAAAAGCLGHLPPCPAAGGPAWTELQSAHFRLRTDEDEADARALLTDLEQLQAALLSVFAAPPDLDTGRLPVVVVDRGWTDFAAREVEGYFTHAVFQPLIVMAAGSKLFSQEVIKHELVHYFSGQIMRRQPPWLSEGLATYYETIEYDAEAGRITVGRPPPDQLRRAQATGAASLERMFTAREIGHDDASGFYADAWLAVHYLMNHRAAALVAYEEALRDGEADEAAWTAAFGSQTPADLSGAIRQYVDGGQYALLIYRFKPPAPPELSVDPGDPRAAAKGEIEEALRQQPDQSTARAIAHFVFDAPVDLAEARRATETSAGDWLAWLLLAEAFRQRGDAVASSRALDRAAAIAQADPSVTLSIVRAVRP